MKTYPIKVINFDIYFNNGSNILIDTGSPVSFHKSGKLSIGEDTFSVPTSVEDVDIDCYSCPSVGFLVEGLLGMDYISRQNTIIDIPGRTITFDADTDGFVETPSLVTNDSILIDVSIEGHDTRVFLNTGAASYIDSAITDGMEPYWYTEDYHPAVGEFTTQLYEVDVMFAGMIVTPGVGNLPAKLQEAMIAKGGHGTIGIGLIEWTPILISGGKVLLKK